MPLLTELQVRAARPQDKAYKLFDSQGLFLLVSTSGSRLWRFRFKTAGGEKLLALGSYPEVSLKEARERRDEARRRLASGIDPSVQRRIRKTVGADDTFKAVALEWLEKQRGRFAEATWVKTRWTFNDLIFPFIGSRPIKEITAPEIFL